MQYFKYLIIFSITFIVLNACKKDERNIIPKTQLAKINVEMHLADEILELNSNLKPSADTLGVYISILNRYGYTIEDYEGSVAYYLKNKNEYVKIMRMANSIVANRIDSLRALLDLEARFNKELWVIKEIEKSHIQDLELRPYHRVIKWLIRQNDTIIWKFTDEAITDIPTNAEWWAKNSSVNINDTLPILTKEYIISEIIKEREEVRNGNSTTDNNTKVNRIKVDKSREILIKDSLSRNIKRPTNLQEDISLVEGDSSKINDRELRPKREIEKVDSRTGNPIIKVN